MSKPSYHKILYLLKAAESKELDFLDRHNEQELAALYEKISGEIYKEQSDIWERIANAVKFFPEFVVAKVAEDILGPVITANVTYYLPARKSISISGFFSNEFLSTVLEHIIPVKVKDILAIYPIERMKKVTKILLKRKKYFTLSSFVEYLPIQKCLDVANSIEDKEEIIRIAIYIENKSTILEIIRVLPDESFKLLLSKAIHANLIVEVCEILKLSQESDRNRIYSLINSLDSSISQKYLEIL